MFKKMMVCFFIAVLGYLAYDVFVPEPLPLVDQASKRSINTGTVVGFADQDQTHIWLGIPFAQPPVGPLRWRAPVAAKAWSGVRTMLRFSPRCPQVAMPMESGTDKTYIGNEDCLYLNVAAPQYKPASVPKGDKRLPVAVWIHGGGNIWGSASQYAAVKNLAGREQVITVSINYRLGILGWFSHPAIRDGAETTRDQSGNFGTLDIIQGLEWVQNNISNFGGDPANVTIIGESAGGRNVYSLLASPAAKGLFHKAIIQSGMPMSFSVAEAENFIDDSAAGHVNSSSELINRLLIADAKASSHSQAKAVQRAMGHEALRNYMVSKTTEQLFSNIEKGGVEGYSAPTVIRDGVVLLDKPIISLLANPNDYNAVPVIIGTNRDEMKTLMMMDADYIDQRFGLLPALKDLDSWNRDTAYISNMWKVLGADEPATVMLEGGNKNVFVYRFDWDEVNSNWLIDWRDLLGAAHSLEIPFVFTDFDNELSFLPFSVIEGENFEQASLLAKAMSSYWGAFFHQGKPGKGRHFSYPLWKPWQTDPQLEQFIIFDTDNDGGVRMGASTLSRQSIRQQMLRDQLVLGGAEKVCNLYEKLFADNPYFYKRLAEQQYQPLVEGGCSWES